MIGSLRGRIASKTPPQLTVEVGGLGYELEAPMSTFFHLPAVGEEVRLLTHLVVREDAHVLYAFATEEERRLFRSLIRVSGVGPKIALALLSGISVSAFIQCVRNEDIAALTRVPGVGRKTAERLIVEMRDRLAAPHPTHETPAAAATFRQPCATTVSLPPQQSITPKPVRREPGSSPSTRTLSSAALRAALGSNARQDLVRYLDIRVNVPYLVQPLERIQQLHHRHGLLARQHDRRRGALRDLGGRGLEAAVREDRPHGVELERIRQHFHRAVAVGTTSSAPASSAAFMSRSSSVPGG